jgi:hypothetical protein
MAHEALVLVRARRDIRSAVLEAIGAEGSDSGDAIKAWEQVDQAARELVAARAEYDALLKEMRGPLMEDFGSIA